MENHKFNYKGNKFYRILDIIKLGGLGIQKLSIDEIFEFLESV